jgi:hypothetical protein
MRREESKKKRKEGEQGALRECQGRRGKRKKKKNERKKEKGREREREGDTYPIVDGWEKIMLSPLN